MCEYITIDNKHFFNVHSTKLKVEYVQCEDVNVDDAILKKHDLVIAHWRDVQSHDVNSYDVVIDNTYNEIDVEVKLMCDALNTHIHGLRTVTSCSGHGQRNAFVAM